MGNRRTTAVILIFVMLSAGCLGAADDIAEEDIVPVVNQLNLSVAFIEAPSSATLGEIVSLQISVQSQGEGEWLATVLIYPEVEFAMTQSEEIVNIIFMPSEIVSYEIVATFEAANSETLIVDGPIIATHNILVSPPVEGAPILNSPSLLSLEQSGLIWISGSITHDYLNSCSLSYSSEEEQGQVDVKSDGTWKILVELYDGVAEMTVTFVATCGEWTVLSDTSVTNIIVENAGTDADGDGILDDNDNCPNGIGESEGWISSTTDDIDSDGCRDRDEDDDDDGDGIDDVKDNCPNSVGWKSTLDADYDQDGCHDESHDLDDDGDAVDDLVDSCPMGLTGWTSNLYSDWDGDGCSDLDEDNDDDNDQRNDTIDSCPKGLTSWIRDTLNDFDDDGCYDSSEDDDDDNDGINDYNATGATLDLCPRTPLSGIDVDENGCASIQRDSDSDGVLDFYDMCEGTPSNIVVNAVGCADIDSDGIFSNVDICPDTPQRWTANSSGCAVLQQPIAWTSATSLNGPMQAVPHFSVPTLDGTFYFEQKWNGEDVYLFMFKYTNGDGSSNSATWGQNPGKLIRALPDNTHLFYGSFDSTYHNDVTQRKSSVLAALNPSEETKWADRIHYIDQRASSIGGGLGQMINSFNNPVYMGIDRFQLSREVGSFYDWPTQSNDPSHIAFEPVQWNVEFPTKVRELDPGVEVVTIMDFQNHAGGWSGGFSSFSNATFDLTNNISSYDTLEVFHEHACPDRENRHSNSDGSSGGCHEWDYLANLYICDAQNSSICNTEIMRWITTYGREGMWLTDISPYLFMIDDGEDRRFKYGGANKGDLTVKFLFSNWESGERSYDADFAFSGGQFDGTYNNESKYTRQLNFTVPSWATKVSLVATITGHGFNKDAANCAEFCDHEHHYYLNGSHTYEWHPVAHNQANGCKVEIANGVVANQYGSWPYGRAGWCAGQDVKQWTYDITSWSNMDGGNNHLTYRGLFNGQEYTPSENIGNGQREIRAVIYVVYSAPTIS